MPRLACCPMDGSPSQAPSEDQRESPFLALGDRGHGAGAVAAIFAAWLGERHPGTRWVVERREGGEGRGVAAGTREVGGELGGVQEARSFA